MGAGADERLANRSRDNHGSEFPKYLLMIDNKERFLSLDAAGIAFDSGWQSVDIVGKVLEEDYSVRGITPEEEAMIQQVADNYSSSK